jgi:hypothetical protein
MLMTALKNAFILLGILKSWDEENVCGGFYRKINFDLRDVISNQNFEVE